MFYSRAKILHLVNQSQFGGSQQYILDLAAHQSAHGAEVMIAAGEAIDKVFVERVADIARTRFLHLPRVSSHISILKEISAVREIQRIINTTAPTLIHVHSPKLNLLTALARRISCFPRVPICYTIHGFWLNEPHNWLKHSLHYVIEWLGMRYMNYIVCVAQSEIRDLHKARVLHARVPCEVISTALNPNRVSFASRETARDYLQGKAPLPIKDKFCIGVVGNLYKQKGVEVLLDALAQMQDKDIAVFIMGKGILTNELSRLIRKKGLERKVFLTGFVPAAAKYFQGFDLLVHPSQKEGVPLALLEAIAAGMPVVATQVGGVPELQQSNWILISPNNASSLADALDAAHTLKRHRPQTTVELNDAYQHFLSQYDAIYARMEHLI